MNQTEAINCPNCASPLKLLGGGRVKTITCSYCKSILDIDKEFKILGHFKDTQEAYKRPFKIGMQGEIKGINYTIIGRISYYDSYSILDQWDDFLLFSPLYGYAWLTYEKGHTIYSRRHRTFPNIKRSLISSMDSIIIDGEKYTYLEEYIGIVHYVEGELTWIAKKGDKTTFIELNNPPFGISIEKSKSEIEYYKSEYMDNKEIYTAFSVPKEEQKDHNNIHALKAFGELFFQPLYKVALGSILTVFLLIFIILFDGQGEKVTELTTTSRTIVKQKFTIKSEKYLTTIHLKSPKTKDLNNFNIQVRQKEKLLLSVNKSSVYIDAQLSSQHLNTWGSRAKDVKVYLHLPKGIYDIHISPINKELNSSIELNIKQKEVRVNYFIWFFIALLGIILYYFWKKKKYQEEISDEEAYSIFSIFWNIITSLPIMIFLVFLFIFIKSLLD